MEILGLVFAGSATDFRAPDGKLYELVEARDPDGRSQAHNAALTAC